MLLPLKNMSGQQVGEIDLSDNVFGVQVNSAVMHQSLMRQLANARLGTHNTKTRGEVEGGGKKPWRQKGTGRARQGSTRAPNFIGGGKVFGPTPHKYTKALPKKMMRAALRSALTAKAAAGQIVVLDEVATTEYKTKTFVNMLSALGIGNQRVLMVVGEKNEHVYRSAGNIPRLTTLLSGYINVRDLLGHDVLLMSNGAVQQIVDWLSVPDAAEQDDASETATPVQVAATQQAVPEPVSDSDAAATETDADAPDNSSAE